VGCVTNVDCNGV